MLSSYKKITKLDKTYITTCIGSALSSNNYEYFSSNNYKYCYVFTLFHFVLLDFFLFVPLPWLNFENVYSLLILVWHIFLKWKIFLLFFPKLMKPNTSFLITYVVGALLLWSFLFWYYGRMYSKFSLGFVA